MSNYTHIRWEANALYIGKYLFAHITKRYQNAESYWVSPDSTCHVGRQGGTVDVFKHEDAKETLMLAAVNLWEMLQPNPAVAESSATWEGYRARMADGVDPTEPMANVIDDLIKCHQAMGMTIEESALKIGAILMGKEAGQ